MMNGTGFVFSFLHISRATGATISTVATLSTKADITPENNAIATAAQRTLGTLSIIRSASSSGILLSMNRATIPIVPAIIRITLKSIVPRTFSSGSIPETIKTSPDARAMYGLYLLNTSISIYVTAKRTIAHIILAVPL